MRGFLTLPLALACIVFSTNALHASDAGAIDWHKPLIGLPLLHSPSTSPAFHRTGQKDGPTQSLVLTATESNVLGALHPDNGTLAWRHLFDEQDYILTVKKYSDRVASLSGPGGSTFRLFDSLNGHLLVEKRLRSPDPSKPLESPTTGVALAFDSVTDTDVYILNNGAEARKLDSVSGEVAWSWTSPDQTSLVVYSSMLSTPSALYVIGLAKSFSSYTIHITSLSPSTGIVIESVDVPSSVENGASDLFVLNRASPKLVSDPDPSASEEDSSTPHLVWLSQGSIHSLPLSPALKEKPTKIKGSVYKKVIDIGLCEHGHFVGIKEDGSGRVVKLTDKGALKVIWEFSDSATADTYTGSIYSGGLDRDGLPYISRVFWSHVFKKASAHVFAPHLSEGKGLVTGFTFPFDTSTHGIITHVAVDTVNPEHYRVLSRHVLTTSTGSIQLWTQDQLQWVREEGLSGIKVAEWVELPERNVLTSGGGVARGEDEGFWARLVRQIEDAKDFPQYALNFAKRFATGTYASPSSVHALANSSTTTTPTVSHSSNLELTRDIFGLRKLLVVATTHGKLYALDSANGEVVWSRVFGLGWAGESGPEGKSPVGARITPLKAFTIRGVGDVNANKEGDVAEVVILAQRKANNDLVDTVAFHVNALTGQDLSGSGSLTGVLEGKDVIPGPLVDAFFVPNNANVGKKVEKEAGGGFVVLFDEFLQANLYPSTPKIEEKFKSLLPALHFPLRTTSPPRLSGHKVSLEKDFTGKHIAYSIWTTSFGPNEEVIGVVKPSGQGEGVASFGKVLGNRTTLYKYLNHGLVVVLTASSPSSSPEAPATTPDRGNCGIYVVDGAKGSILYHSVLPALPQNSHHSETSTDKRAVCDIKAVLTENWLVYHYYVGEEEGQDDARSYRVVSVEFYEGGVDEKSGSSDSSSYSRDITKVNVHEQTFIFPRGITAMATTTTKYGISIKDIIVAGQTHQIQTFPRRFLDPRRPKRKPTAEEAEEWLMQYDALLPDDPKRVLSHRYQVARINSITTSPSLLESTSLVFAYGLDLFFTRTAPSNTFDILSESFNKVQLVLTVVGLALAILITKPIVESKKLKARWYD